MNNILQNITKISKCNSIISLLKLHGQDLLPAHIELLRVELHNGSFVILDPLDVLRDIVKDEFNDFVNNVVEDQQFFADLLCKRNLEHVGFGF